MFFFYSALFILLIVISSKVYNVIVITEGGEAMVSKDVCYKAVSLLRWSARVFVTKQSANYSRQPGCLLQSSQPTTVVTRDLLQSSQPTTVVSKDVCYKAVNLQ